MLLSCSKSFRLLIRGAPSVFLEAEFPNVEMDWTTALEIYMDISGQGCSLQQCSVSEEEHAVYGVSSFYVWIQFCLFQFSLIALLAC